MTAPAGGRRLLAVVAGVGIVLTVPPTPALAARPQPDPEEAAALALLDAAAGAARSLTYSGTQYVATWRDSGATSALVEFAHSPAAGARVELAPTAETADAAEAVLAGGGVDERLLRVLGERYVLRVVGADRCAGRVADVVEARRPGTPEPHGLAGRFWVDRESGLILRREVLDGRGRQVHSSAFVDLAVEDPSPAPAPAATAAATAAPVASGQREAGPDSGRRLGRERIAQLRRDGWPVPETLPGGFTLFDATVRAAGPTGRDAGRPGEPSVVHLAYSDGLSTTSLFAQPGDLGAEPPDGFRPREVGGTTVWVRGGTPERVVWAGGGRVWTLVSDAPPEAVTAAVRALPHDDPPRDRLLDRLSRGAARLADLLNPFS